MESETVKPGRVSRPLSRLGRQLTFSPAKGSPRQDLGEAVPPELREASRLQKAELSTVLILTVGLAVECLGDGLLSSAAQSENPPWQFV